MQVALLSANAKAGDAIGNQVAEKLAALLERGADARVFVEDEQRLHPVVRPHCQRVGTPEPGSAAWRFLSAADLVVVEFSQDYALLGLLPLLAGARPRILYDYHGVTPAELWEPSHREALERGAMYRGLVWCADAALVHSRFTGRELREHTGFPAERLRLLGYPVDTDRYAAGPPGGHLRSRRGLGQATLLLFVGRLARNKRVPLLVEALARLRDRVPPVHAVVVGDTGDLYQTEARCCRDRARELGVADRLHLLGHVSEAQLVDAYRSADVFVMPSVHEGFCVPVVEAMACGVPVVAARAAALPETVGAAGLMFTPDDAEDLVRQLRRVLGVGGEGQDGTVERLRRQGLERAAAHDRVAWRKEFSRLVEDLLHAPRGLCRQRVAVRPHSERRTASSRLGATLVPVQVSNQGTYPIVPDGPARMVLHYEIVDPAGRVCLGPSAATALPGLLLPGHTVDVAVPVSVPATPGVYGLTFSLQRGRGTKDGAAEDDRSASTPPSADGCPSAGPAVHLIVEEDGQRTARPDCSSGLDAVLAQLVEAERRQRLPDDYADVTEGLFAAWKRRVKRKLLGNFKQCYVDVLSRQQSAFNRHIFGAVHELVECCRVLDGAAQRKSRRAGRTAGLVRRLADSERRCAALEERLAKLEAELAGRGV
jgi:glycosyltransferase involved in cell wall biosynthesis